MSETSQARILVVDDEQNVLLTMAAILREDGYTVDEASGGQVALELIEKQAYDLVITDLKMPGIDGLKVLAGVRDRSPYTVTLMLTGYGSVESAVEALHLGAYEYLIKPTPVEDLKAAVRRSLERRKLSEIDTLYRLNQGLVSTFDVANIREQVADAARRVLGVERVQVLLASDQKIGRDHPLAYKPIRDALHAGGMLTHHQLHDAAQEWSTAAGVSSYALVPGCVRGELVCVLFADHDGKPHEFHAASLRFLQSLAAQAALALENARLVNALQQSNAELTEANTKLTQLDQLKSQFLSVATHELRTPLTVMLGYHSMLADSLADRLGEDEREMLSDSVAACKRLIRLVNSMLDITQIESGKMRMEFTPTDLRQLTNDVVALFRHETDARNQKLKTELPARLPKINVDPERVQQVLINLIGNAIKFTGEGGSITVALRHLAADERVELVVRDTGIGIPDDQQALIFEEFVQVHRHAKNRQKEGSGLGLAIARRIIEAHGGEIRVSSRPGEGSTFTVSLPASKASRYAVSA